MKKFSVACFVILMVSVCCFAKLMPIPLNERVKNSDLIIIGTLQYISESDKDGVIIGEGKILVEEVITNNIFTNENLLLASDDKLNLKWREGFACVYGWHSGTSYQKGIWLLSIESDGSVRAGHGNFFDLSELSEVKSYLLKLNLDNTAKKVEIRDSKSILVSKVNTESKDIKSEIVINTKLLDDSTFNSSDNNSPLGGLLVFLLAFFLYRFLYRNK